VDDGDPVVCSCVLVADGTARIRGAVIHEDDLHQRVGLGEQGVQALADVALDVADGHYGRDAYGVVSFVAHIVLPIMLALLAPT